MYLDGRLDGESSNFVLNKINIKARYFLKNIATAKESVFPFNETFFHR